MTNDSEAYIGVRPCGCVTFALVRGIETPASEAKEVARVIRTGRVIQSVSAEEARRRLTFDCPHDPMWAKS